MASKRGMDKFLVSFIIVMATILVVSETTMSSYWQTFVRNQASKLKETSRNICFPNQTYTRESLGNIVSKNISSLCIENTVVVGKLDKVGWSSDFKATKSVLTVIITSCSSKLMANMLSNFVIFVSDSHLHQTSNYVSRGNECARYKGRGFKPNEKITFKCNKVVRGRYVYIWALGSNRIQSAFIDKINFEFAIKVEVNPRNPMINPTEERGKKYSISFSHLSGWGEKVSKGYWIVTLGKTYVVNTVLIGVSKTIIATLGGLIVDVGTANSKGQVGYGGRRMSVLSADKTGFLVKVNMKGNSIRIKGKKGNGYLTDTAVTFLEMMCVSGGSNLYFKNVVKITKRDWYVKAVQKPNLKGQLQVWQDASVEVTGWIMIDMKKRYLVTGVSIFSGSNSKSVTDLQGLIIATSNFIPDQILSQSDKLEADICGQIGSAVRIVTNKPNYLKCLPEPSLGAFVLLYNKLKPLRLSAIKMVRVYIQLNTVFFFQFKLPYYPRIPNKPPPTTLHLSMFFVETTYGNSPSGYWVLDLLSPRRVDAVVVTAGVTSNTLRSFTVYVQDTFFEDLIEVCARFMTKHFKTKTSKYLKCTPGPKTGHYVIVANEENGILVDSISNIEVWFFNGRLERTNPHIQPKNPPAATPDSTFRHRIDWTIIYSNLHYSSSPKGWWLFDLGSSIRVSDLLLVLNYDVTILRYFRDVYVGLTNKRDDLKPSVCEYKSKNGLISRKEASSYRFVCSNSYTYRYIIIRSALDCDKFNLKSIKKVEIHAKFGGSYKSAIIDLSSFSKPLINPKSSWKGSTAAKLYKDSGKFVYSFDFKSTVEMASVELRVKYNTKVSEIEVLMNTKNNFKNGYKTCYWHKSPKAEAFYAGSKYLLRCSYSGMSFR